MTHIMLDLETWGKRPGCDIRSIGACVFDPVSGFVHDGSLGTIKPFYVACSDGDTYNLTRDPDTVQWWSGQSDDAQSAFADPVDLAVALHEFVAWLSCVTKSDTDLRIYAHGPQFDCSILEAAYHVVGLPVPWHYRAPRDTRTVFDLCGVGDHSEWMKQYPVGTAHHALDDAISQARAVCGAVARLRVTHDVLTHRAAWRDMMDTAYNVAGSFAEYSEATQHYIQHEQRAFDRTFDALAQHPHLEK